MSTNLRIFTTEYTEFHGGKERYRIKTPWYSKLSNGQQTSVVIFLIKLAHMVFPAHHSLSSRSLTW
jgi:hypothetical protein